MNLSWLRRRRRASHFLIKLNKAETKNVHNARPNKRNFLLKRGSGSSSKERTNGTSDRTGKRANNCSIRESKLPSLPLSQRQTLKRAIFTGYWRVVDGEKSTDSRGTEGNGNQLTPATHTCTYTQSRQEDCFSLAQS